VYYLLEDDFELMLVNARHVKHVPGRETDTIDACWIAQLLAHGLLRRSFVPPKPIRRLRDLTRYRKALIEERSRAVTLACTRCSRTRASSSPAWRPTSWASPAAR